jgi:D-alanyl-D-alanine carboxypeptidase/D-alanyl-D-alanine-endopeptidase (penicillin-binding protein 4)
VARGRPATTDEGVAIVLEVVTGLGLPIAGAAVTDGSGLGTGNLMSCSLVEAILDRSGPSSVIGRGLPIAGQTGTLSERFVGTDVTGRMLAKTGTLNQVTALAGFVDTIPGSSLTFSFLVNLEGDDRVDEDDLARQDELAAILVRYPEGPSLDELGPRPIATPGGG